MMTMGDTEMTVTDLVPLALPHTHTPLGASAAAPGNNALEAMMDEDVRLPPPAPRNTGKRIIV